MAAADARSGLGRRLAAGAVQVAMGRLAALALWIVSTPFLVRGLGSEKFAIWALFYAMTSYLFALDLGFAQGTLRMAGSARERGRPEEAAGFARLALGGYTLIGLVWLAVSLTFGQALLDWLRIPVPLRREAMSGMLLGAAVVAMTGAANVGMSLLQGFGRFDLATRVMLSMTTVQALGMALVLTTGRGLTELFLTTVVAGAVGCALSLALTKQQPLGQARIGSWRSHLREAVRFGGPMQAANVLAAVHAHVGKLFLSRFVGLASVTSYELGARVAGVSSTFPQLMLLPLIPEASALDAAGERGRLRELHDRMGRYYLAAVAVVSAAMLAATDRLYVVWLGQPDAGASLSLLVLGASITVSLFSGVWTAIARGVGRTDLEAWCAGVGCVLHVALGLALVPRFGLPGALAAASIGNVVAIAMFAVMFGRVMGWSVGDTVLGPCIVPLVAILLGAGAGRMLSAAMPYWPGALGWMSLGLVAGTGAAVVLALVLGLRYVRWHEARALIGGLAAPAAQGRR